MAALPVLDRARDATGRPVEWEHLLSAGMLFALAGPTRETALAFPVAVALAWCMRGRFSG